METATDGEPVGDGVGRFVGLDDLPDEGIHVELYKGMKDGMTEGCPVNPEDGESVGERLDSDGSAVGLTEGRTEVTSVRASVGCKVGRASTIDGEAVGLTVVGTYVGKRVETPIGSDVVNVGDEETGGNDNVQVIKYDGVKDVFDGLLLGCDDGFPAGAALGRREGTLLGLRLG